MAPSSPLPSNSSFPPQECAAENTSVFLTWHHSLAFITTTHVRHNQLQLFFVATRPPGGLAVLNVHEGYYGDDLYGDQEGEEGGELGLVSPA